MCEQSDTSPAQSRGTRSSCNSPRSSLESPRSMAATRSSQRVNNTNVVDHQAGWQAGELVKTKSRELAARRDAFLYEHGYVRTNFRTRTPRHADVRSEDWRPVDLPLSVHRTKLRHCWRMGKAVPHRYDLGVPVVESDSPTRYARARSGAVVLFSQLGSPRVQ